MNKALIRQLNQLNQKFYRQVATSFSHSRSYYWQGWNKLIPYLQELAESNPDRELTVLDIGCGNGRFGLFLSFQLPKLKIKYIGVDNNPKLLKIAKEQLLPTNTQSKFLKLDLIKALLNPDPKKTLAPQLKKFKPNFITALGVLHHIPGAKQRQNFIQDLGQILTTPGYLAFTSWNFLDTKRFHKKIIAPEKVRLEAKKLEKNDVILDWKKGETAYRYCHYTDKKELEAITQNSGLKKVSIFKADGKSARLNTYSILKRE